MSRAEKKPQGRGNGAGVHGNHSLPSECSDGSTTTKAQRARILQALQRRPHTSYDLRLLGCYQAPTRIKELRDKFGYAIDTARVTVVDHEGYSHPRVALYSLRAAGGGL